MTPSTVARVFVPLLALSLTGGSAAGCADPSTNAILELDLDLPPHLSVIDTHAVVRIRAGEADFTALWSDADTAASFPLVQDARRTASLSVVAERELDFVSVKVRFCEDARCASDPEGLSPEVHVLIAHPLYLGEYSRVRIEIEAIPTAWERLDVGRCAVQACSEEVRESYCDAEGRHFCATGG